MRTKQVIVMRTSYPDGKGGVTGIRKGKMIAQACHASLAFLTRRIEENHSGERTVEMYQKYGDFDLYGFLNLTKPMVEWLNGSFAKICCQVDSEEELVKIYEKAVEAGLETHMVVDSGKTEFHGIPTKTCLAIGPDLSEKIDEITGHLKLL